ncbi:hypothetical protein J6590_032882 [Homalodisca vitripennis]|nr:hypothetical protein J6590_032882 [Homalodisca vitripennis]
MVSARVRRESYLRIGIQRTRSGAQVDTLHLKPQPHLPEVGSVNSGCLRPLKVADANANANAGRRVEPPHLCTQVPEVASTPDVGIIFTNNVSLSPITPLGLPLVYLLESSHPSLPGTYTSVPAVEKHASAPSLPPVGYKTYNFRKRSFNLIFRELQIVHRYLHITVPARLRNTQARHPPPVGYKTTSTSERGRST